MVTPSELCLHRLWYLAHKDLKKRGFGDFIVADKNNFFAFFNLKGQIIKKFFAIKRFSLGLSLQAKCRRLLDFVRIKYFGLLRIERGKSSEGELFKLLTS